MKKKQATLPKLFLPQELSDFLERLHQYSDSVCAFYYLINNSYKMFWNERTLYALAFPKAKDPKAEETYDWHCMVFQGGVRAALQQFIHQPDPTLGDRLVDLVLLCYQKHAYRWERTSDNFRRQLHLFFAMAPKMRRDQREALRLQKAEELRGAYLAGLDPKSPEDQPWIALFLQDSQLKIRWSAYRKLEEIGEQPPRWSLAFHQDPYALLEALEADAATKHSWREIADALIETLYTQPSPSPNELLARLKALPLDLGIEAFAVLGADLDWLRYNTEQPFNPLAHPKGIEVLMGLIKVWRRSMYAMYYQNLFKAWREQAPEGFSAWKDTLLYNLFHTEHTGGRRSLRRCLEDIARYAIPDGECPSFFSAPPPEYAFVEGRKLWFLESEATGDSPQADEAEDEQAEDGDEEAAVGRIPPLPQLVSSEELDRIGQAIDQAIDLYIEEGETEDHWFLKHRRQDQDKLEEQLRDLILESMPFLFCAYANEPQERGLYRALSVLDWSTNLQMEEEDQEIIESALEVLLVRMPNIPLSHIEKLCEMEQTSIRYMMAKALRPEVLEQREWLDKLRRDQSGEVRAAATKRLSTHQEIPRWSLGFTSDPLGQLDPTTDAAVVETIDQILVELEGGGFRRKLEGKPLPPMEEMVDQLPERLAIDLIGHCAQSLHSSHRYAKNIRRLLRESVGGLELFLRLVQRWSKGASRYEYEHLLSREGEASREVFERMLAFWQDWNARYVWSQGEAQERKTQREVYTRLLAKLWPTDYPLKEWLVWFEGLSVVGYDGGGLAEAFFSLLKRLPVERLPMDTIFKGLQETPPNKWLEHQSAVFELLEAKLPTSTLEEWSQALLSAAAQGVVTWAFNRQSQALLEAPEQMEQWVQLSLSQPKLRKALFSNYKYSDPLLQQLQQVLLQGEFTLNEALHVWGRSIEEDARLPYASTYALGEETPLPPFVTRLAEHPAPKNKETYPTIPTDLAEALRHIRKRFPPQTRDEWNAALHGLPRYDWHPEDEALVWSGLEFISERMNEKWGRTPMQLVVALLYIPHIEAYPQEQLLTRLEALVGVDLDEFDYFFYRLLAPYLAERLGCPTQRILAMLPKELLQDQEEDDEDDSE